MFSKSFPFFSISLSPIFWYTLSFILGIYLAAHGYLIRTSYALSIFTACGILSSLKMHAQSYRLFWCSCFVLFGFFRFFFLEQKHAEQKSNLFDRYRSFNATVISCDHRAKTEIQLLLTSAKKSKTTHNLHCMVKLFVFRMPQLRVGDTIVLRKLTFKPVSHSSYEWSLLREGFVSCAHVPKLSYTIESRPALHVSRWLAEQRTRVVQRIKGALSSGTFALMSALFFGYQPHDISHYGPLRSHFMWWGVIHFLARSGLHVVLLTASWKYIIRLLPVTFIIKQIILIILLIFYHLLTWPSVSFERAFITFLFYRSFTLTRFSVQSIHVLALTTLSILAYNPLHLFFLDFQLSFGLTLALAWFNEIQLKIKRTASL